METFKESLRKEIERVKELAQFNLSNDNDNSRKEKIIRLLHTTTVISPDNECAVLEEFIEAINHKSLDGMIKVAFHDERMTVIAQKVLNKADSRLSINRNGKLLYIALSEQPIKPMARKVRIMKIVEANKIKMRNIRRKYLKQVVNIKNEFEKNLLSTYVNVEISSAIEDIEKIGNKEIKILSPARPAPRIRRRR